MPPVVTCLLDPKAEPAQVFLSTFPFFLLITFGVELGFSRLVLRYSFFLRGQSIYPSTSIPNSQFLILCAEADLINIKAVIFDMDNTFFDFVDAKFQACTEVLKYVNRYDEKEVMALIGYFLRNEKGIENLDNIADYLQDHDLHTEETYKRACEIYEQTKLDSIHAYDGVRETLEALSTMDLKLAVVTDADRDNAMLRLRKTNLEDFFELIVTIEITGRKKPDPASIAHALDELGVAPEEAILVGDSLIRDIQPAKELGMISAYAAYGDKNFFEERTGAADFVLENIRDLIDIVKQK
jgi:putative hydrolase of the HAD superfamily